MLSAVHPLPFRAAAPRATWIGLLFADASAFTLAAALFIGGSGASQALWVAASVWFLARVIVGLYEPVLLGPHDEARLAATVTLGAAVVHALFDAVIDPAGFNAAGVAALWTTLLILPWGTRQLIKGLLSRSSLYGSPVVVIGSPDRALALIDELRRNPLQALHPVAVFDDGSQENTALLGVPVLGDLDAAVDFEFGYPVDHALVALHNEDTDSLDGWSERLGARYSHVHFTPEFVGLANLWVRPRPLGQLVTFEFRRGGVRPITLAIKRAFDFVFGGLLLLLSLPLIVVCAVAVKLASPGPAFFTQTREGHKGRWIRVWKIRTMVPNAEDLLEDHLREDSSARREWARRVKLDADPRIIPGIGSFMRRWSLDELPQFWNVVNGTLSLVGPRPFTEYHLALFPEPFRDLRRKVPPGVTGLWQVTYRSDGDLSHQQAADSFYIHNWSIWLDLWILMRTVGVVLAGTGV